MTAKRKHVRVINPATLERSSGTSFVTKAGCGERSDAAVCQDGNSDVTCTGELYRGCGSGATDCANVPGGNDDDVCCAGWGPGSGDNIDHSYCYSMDASWGLVSLCFVGDYGNPPAY